MNQPDSKPFTWPVRVYYADTDAGGVVYHANYLTFMERARTEYLRQLGYEQDELIEKLGILFAVRDVTVDYLSPARFNDALEVSAQVEWVKRASLAFHQTITHADSQQVLCEGRVRLVCIDSHKFKSTAVPETIKQAFLS